ncbi:PspC domain-containing protein [Candidatus Saccharibacteria bacterium]|nr:PspC domain-containing protein [Candidatus Saccharibacteria bacterium]MBP7834870.1 PspC domain-containing protein [Candidatus Saccharibacteria bacterium]
MTTTKKLYRLKEDRIIAGICSGFGKYLNIDPVVIRIATVVATLLSGGILVIGYIVGIFLIPEENNKDIIDV